MTLHRNRLSYLHMIIFILALCSIVYELIMAQALSAFLENTVLRYSVTIGLYMFSMGLGAFMAQGRFIRKPLQTLMIIEIILTVIGGFSIIYLYWMDALGASRLVFSLFAHGLILFIGLLSGLEIPLLIEIGKISQKCPENIVLAVDYIGAFAGTLLFAFLFYPVVGLIPTALIIGSLNALSGCLLIRFKFILKKDDIAAFQKLWAIQLALFIVLGVCLSQHQTIKHFFTNQYLNRSF